MILITLKELKNSNSGFLDDKIKSKKIKGIKILGKFKDAHKYKTHYFATALGSSVNFRNNSQVIKKLNIKNRFVTLIHPNTYISQFSKLALVV